VQLAELVVPLGDTRAVDLRQVGTDADGLPLGLLPGAGGLQDLGTVHPADPGEQHGRGQPRQPRRGGVHQLPGAAQIGQLVEGGHHVAVDVADPVRLQLPAEHRDQRLVEQREPLGRPALPDPHPALAQQAHRDQGRVGVPSPDVADAAGGGDDGLVVGVVKGALHLEQIGEVAVLGALGFVGEQPGGPADPARADGLVPAQQEVHGCPDRRRGGLARSALAQVRPVGLPARSDRLVDQAEPPGGVTEGGEVVGAEGGVGAHPQERLTGVRPPVLPVGPTRRGQGGRDGAGSREVGPAGDPGLPPASSIASACALAGIRSAAAPQPP
jgi:hypothetical protein